MEVKLPVDIKLRTENNEESKMKKPYKHLAVLGTLCCISALAVLWMAVLSVDWVSIQEPQVDQLELDKLGPYEEPKPHLIRVKFGLFKMCLQSSQRMAMQQTECKDLDWYNIGPFNLDPSRKPPEMPSALIANCVQKLKFTLPFIGLSVVFTSASFICLTFGHFCQKNKKIIEASMLILAGLCQATALLTFVTQIGSEFEANMPYSHHQQRLTSFYRYKYGYSFYLFLLSFSLSELAALFDMAAYFRKFPPNHYVITFHRQEPSPFMAPSMSPSTVVANPPGPNGNGHHHHHPMGHQTLHFNHNHHHNQARNNFHTLPSNNHLHPYGQPGQGAIINNGPLYSQKYAQQMPVQQQHPDICNAEFNTEHIDLTMQARQITMDHALAYGLPPPPQAQNALNGGPGPATNDQAGINDQVIMPPQSYMSSEVTITTIEQRSNPYGTIRTNPKIPTTSTMESFGTIRKENNI